MDVKVKPAGEIITVKMQIPENEAAKRIAGLFMEREKVSFMQDIVPVLLEKYRFEMLDEHLYMRAEEDIDRALEIAGWAGYNMKGVPRFGGTTDGALIVTDWIYTRMKWV